MAPCSPCQHNLFPFLLLSSPYFASSNFFPTLLRTFSCKLAIFSLSQLLFIVSLCVSCSCLHRIPLVLFSNHNTKHILASISPPQCPAQETFSLILHSFNHPSLFPIRNFHTNLSNDRNLIYHSIPNTLFPILYTNLITLTVFFTLSLICTLSPPFLIILFPGVSKIPSLFYFLLSVHFLRPCSYCFKSYYYTKGTKNKVTLCIYLHQKNYVTYRLKRLGIYKYLKKRTINLHLNLNK